MGVDRSPPPTTSDERVPILLRMHAGPELSVEGNEPSITVVVPAYNEEHYIGEALDAVFAQTSPPLEVIVIDDGSTDRTLEVVEGYRDQVRLITQENRGCPGAFDTGFREAR